MTKNEFIEKFKSKHPEKFNNFDFSNLPENFSTKNDHKFICKKHGLLTKTRIDNFLHFGKCKQCSRENYSNKGIRKISIEDFIKKCQPLYVWKPYEKRDKEKYPDGTPKYDYSITKEFRPIENSHGKFEFDYICPIHGKQTQRVDTHENGHGGCEKCGHIASGFNQMITAEEFFRKCKNIHKNPDGTPKYDYSNSIYNGYGTYMKAYCPIHKHEFEVLTTNHYQGVPGCEYCTNTGTSNIEKELSLYIKSIYSDEIILNTRNILDGKEIDIYLPKLNIGFEFNGLLWHSEYSGKKPNYHQNKYLEAKNKGIHLINIWEDDWSEKQLLIKSRIKQILGIKDRIIYAKDCELKQVDTDEEKSFLIKNHLQEYRKSDLCYGLYYENELVFLMSFGKSFFHKLNDNEYELIRCCSKLNTSVFSGASTIFKYFVKTLNPIKIISYANSDWSIENYKNLYRQLGFKYQHLSEPNYSYVIGKLRHSRYGFTKEILKKKYGCPEYMSEHEFCLSMGWYRIYDNGNLFYIWNNKKFRNI